MLSDKHKRFVAEYLKDLNATKAAERAGYSPKTAYSQGQRLLKHVEVAAAVSKGAEKGLAKAGLTAAATLEAIRRQVERDIRGLFDEQGNARPIHTLTAEQAAMIAGFEIVIKNAEAGDGHTDRVLKLKLQDQSRYVEMAAKHFALLTERVEHSGEVVFQWEDAKRG